MTVWQGVAKNEVFHTNATEQMWRQKQDVESGSNKLTSVGKAMKERCVAKKKAFLGNVLLIVKLHNLLKTS